MSEAGSSENKYGCISRGARGRAQATEGEQAMGNAGLVLVGSAIFVNGLSLLGLLTVKSAAPLNLLVGIVQTVLPTLVLIQSQGDLAIVNATWPVYLFGFTYVWWGIVGWTGIDPTAFGWFSLFIAIICVYQASVSFVGDPIWSAMWVAWAILWGMFFLLLSLRLTALGTLDLGRYAGWLMVFLGIPSCTITAMLMMNEAWSTSAAAGAVAFGVIVVSVIVAAPLAGRTRVAEAAVASAPAMSE